MLSVSSLNVLIEDWLRYQVVQLIFLFMYPSRMLTFLLCFLLISSFICMISSNIHRSIFIGDSLMAWLWNYSFFFVFIRNHTHTYVYIDTFLFYLYYFFGWIFVPLWLNVLASSSLVSRLTDEMKTNPIGMPWLMPL